MELSHIALWFLNSTVHTLQKASALSWEPGKHSLSFCPGRLNWIVCTPHHLSQPRVGSCKVGVSSLFNRWSFVLNVGISQAICEPATKKEIKKNLNSLLSKARCCFPSCSCWFFCLKGSKYSTLSSSRLAIRVACTGCTKPAMMTCNGKPHSAHFPFLLCFPLDGSSADFSLPLKTAHRT